MTRPSKLTSYFAQAWREAPTGIQDAVTPNSFQGFGGHSPADGKKCRRAKPAKSTTKAWAAARQRRSKGRIRIAVIRTDDVAKKRNRAKELRSYMDGCPHFQG